MHFLKITCYHSAIQIDGNWCLDIAFTDINQLVIICHLYMDLYPHDDYMNQNSFGKFLSGVSRDVAYLPVILFKSDKQPRTS